jgi:hypothetical protein
MSESKEIKIKKLVIKIGPAEVSMTPEEAKELQQALNEMFGKEVVHEIHHDWWYRYPIYTTPNPINWPTVYCSNTSSGGLNSLTITAQAE